MPLADLLRAGTSPAQPPGAPNTPQDFRAHSEIARPRRPSEWSVKPSAQPTLVRTQHLPLPVETTPDQHGCGQGLILSGSGGVRSDPGVFGCSWLSSG